MKKMFSKLAEGTAHLAGHPFTCASAFAVVALWAASGPSFQYSERWQLIINTGTTIITFLMVFLIQNTANRDMAAMQAKLDEIIRASDARNEFRGIDRKSEDEIKELRND
jgi:low affinity Fe/Cu permease